MRLLIGGLILSGSLLAQHAGVVNTGPRMGAPSNAYPYGNILFPGGVPNHASRVGASISGRPMPGSISGGPQHGGRPPRTTIVPYAFPVFVGDPYGYAQPYQQQPPQNITVVVPQQPTPQVVINHNYVPERANPVLRDYSTENLPESGIRVYEAPGTQTAAEPVKPTAASPAPALASDRPTIYLIALKDSTIQSAIGYWMEGGVLHYVTLNGVVNRVSLDRLDRDLTNQLNAERKVEFSLRD